MKNFNRWIRSKAGMATLAGAIIIILAVAILGQSLGWWGGAGTAGLPTIPQAQYASPAAGFTCLPSCDESDGRFLVVAGNDLNTLGDVKIVAWIAVPGNTTSFQLGIFDGDSGKDSNGAINPRGGNWDNARAQSTYTLIADPLKDAAGQQVVASWRGNQDNLPNNAWFETTINHVEAAKAPSGHYMYRLEISGPEDNKGLNAFKLRSNAYLSTGKSNQTGAPIGVIASLLSTGDARIIYPQYTNTNNLGPVTTYNGQWVFHLFLPVDTQKLEIWDGDFDRGTAPLPNQPADTDDPNTEGKPGWANQNALPEGVGGGSGKGAPPDDYATFAPYLRSPAVWYSLTDPDGQPVYVNENPSGTEEWEKFILSTDPNANADVTVPRIKPGFYTLNIEGLDMFNAVWLYTTAEVCDPVSGCGPCVWPGCDNTACPRTIGYWKNNVKKVLIDQTTRGVQESPETLDWALKNVALGSKVFRTGINVQQPTVIANPARLTNQEANMILQRDQKTYPGGKDQANSMLARALQQNLAAWLNLGSGKISDNTVVTLNVAGGPFNGTIWEALQEAEGIILNGGNLERAKDIGDQINNGLLGENADVGSCDAGTGDAKDYQQTMPKEKQPPQHSKMPKAPKPDVPKEVAPGPAPVCTSGNTYNVENPTNNPFYGIKFEYASGTEVKDGGYDTFKVTLPAEVVQAMSASGIQLEAKAATNVGVVTLAADFTSPVGDPNPLKDDSGLFGFAFGGAVDNGDGTYTLTFVVYVFDTHGLSHATIGLPEGAVPAEGGSYTSEACTAP